MLRSEGKKEFSLFVKEELRIPVKRLLIKPKIVSAEEAPLPSSEGKNETVQS